MPRRLYFFITNWRTGSGVRGENTCHTGLRASENSQLSTSALGSVPASDEYDVDLGRGAGGLVGHATDAETIGFPEPQDPLSNQSVWTPFSDFGSVCVFHAEKEKSKYFLKDPERKREP